MAAPDWQGLHFGIAAARPSGDNFWAERSLGAESAPGDWSGSLPTLSAGYDFQRGKLVYGVTLAVSGGDMTANPVSGGIFGCGGCQTDVDKLTTLRGSRRLSNWKDADLC
jgi:outer membrane immunogenic protein